MARRSPINKFDDDFEQSEFGINDDLQLDVVDYQLDDPDDNLELSSRRHRRSRKKRSKRRTGSLPFDFDGLFKYLPTVAIIGIIILLLVVFRDLITSIIATILGWCIMLLIAYLIIKYIFRR